MVTLTCTFCGQPAFAKLRIEIALGAATYLVCNKPGCINTASIRARDNLNNAAKKLQTWRPPVRAIAPDPDSPCPRPE